eukprot:3187632-Amphidinium_carterae.1
MEQQGRSFWSEAWSSYYKGKGKGKAKGKFQGPRRNPRGKDGQPMRCHRCGSTEHLIAKCPVPHGSAPGSSAPAPPQQSHLASTSGMSMPAMQSAPDLGSMERHTEPLYTPGRAQQAGVLLAHYSMAEATSDGTHSACASWQQIDSTDLMASSTS